MHPFKVSLSQSAKQPHDYLFLYLKYKNFSINLSIEAGKWVTQFEVSSAAAVESVETKMKEPHLVIRPAEWYYYDNIIL